MSSLLIPTCILIIGILSFLKDFDRFTIRGRWIYAVTLIALYLFSIKREFDVKATTEGYKLQIASLKQTHEDEKDSHEKYEKSTIQRIDNLNQTVTNLKAQAVSEKLGQELAATQQQLLQIREELNNTQKALKPAPKAQLEFTEHNSALMERRIITKEITAIADNNVVRFDIGVLNTSEVNALNAELMMRICEGCKFAEEPPGWRKLDGSYEKDRNIFFSLLGAHKASPKSTLAIIPPEGLQWFKVTLSYDCSTCDANPAKQDITVRFVRATGATK